MKIRPMTLVLAAALLTLTVSCGASAGEKAGGGTATTQASADDAPATTAGDDDSAEPADDTATTDAGDDSTEPADDTPTTEAGDGDIESSIPDADAFSTEEKLAAFFEEQGLPAEQADCVAGAVFDSGLMEGGFDPSSTDTSSPEFQEYTAALQECILGG